MKNWQIICDFDGTMVDIDVTDAILEKFAHPDWVKIEEAWLAGEFGSKICMERQIMLIHASQQELDAFLDTIKLDTGFAAFAHWCSQKGFPLTIVSDGIDYSIKRILNRHHLGSLPVIANALEIMENNQYKLTFPYAHPACTSGVCKCQTMRRERVVDAYKTLLIGDGRSDFCIAEKADLVFASKKLIHHCIEQKIPYFPYENFNQVLKLAEAALLHTA